MRLYSNFQLKQGKEVEWIHFLAGMVCWANWYYGKPVMEFKPFPSEYWDIKLEGDVCINFDETLLSDTSDFGREFDKERKKRGLSYRHDMCL